MSNSSMATLRWGGVALVAVVATACGGSGGQSAPAAKSAPASTSASASTSAGASMSGAARVGTRTGPLGSYLADPAGRTLYLFVADKGTTSVCYGSCATYWPPLLTSGMPGAASGAKASLLGTTKRTDGHEQVTYAGHPLYYFAGDAKAGDTKGQGVNASGRLWWMLTPSGATIKTKAPAATSSSRATKGYGGSGY